MWNLVPQQGMECRPPALEAQSLSQYTTRDVPIWDFQSLAFVNNSAKNTGLKGLCFCVCEYFSISLLEELSEYFPNWLPHLHF